ncbi:pantoate--beta-alanine ligase [Chitinophagaceae bacterium LWZ2-11]
MILFKQIQDIQKYLHRQQQENQKIGFIPTMGALHAGHLSLLQASKKETGITVCSIFVNPTQFNDPKDFEKYPITINEDILLLEKAGCDVLFLPSVEEMYPQGQTLKKEYPLGRLEQLLDGKYRPGHFQGVCQVVERLLDIIEPDLLFLGQKDYQQCMVLRKMLEITGKNAKISLNICPTLRETSGLAMSSRNMRLSQDQREQALAIYQTLTHIKNNLTKYSFDQLIAWGEGFLSREGFAKIDYISIADAKTLEPLENNNQNKELVCLIAAFMGDVRLIDNMILK